MRDLVRQGKTIICTIHQPSSEVFEKFDRLCLLAEGRLAYIGDLSAAEKFFSNQGFNIPVHYNPADYYIKTLAVIPNQKDESLKIIDKVCTSFETSAQYKILDDEIKDSNEMASDPNRSIKLKNSIRYKNLNWIFITK